MPGVRTPVPMAQEVGWGLGVRRLLQPTVPLGGEGDRAKAGAKIAPRGTGGDGALIEAAEQAGF